MINLSKIVNTSWLHDLLALAFNSDHNVHKQHALIIHFNRNFALLHAVDLLKDLTLLLLWFFFLCRRWQSSHMDLSHGHFGNQHYLPAKDKFLPQTDSILCTTVCLACYSSTTSYNPTMGSHLGQVPLRVPSCGCLVSDFNKDFNPSVSDGLKSI